MWIAGLAPTGMAVNAMKRNHVSNMNLAISGTYVFIFGGIFYGIYDTVHDILHLVNEGKPHSKMKMINDQIPSVILLYVLFSFSIFIHGKVIYHARKLVKAWKFGKKR